MTAEPRDVEEIVLRRQVRLMMALCDSGLVRIEPTEPDDGVGVAWIRVMDAAKIAAADRENAELRGEVERLRSDLRAAKTTIEEMFAEAEQESNDLRAQLAAAQAQLAEARAAIASYEHRISWDTTCENCAHMLDASYADYVRADAAEARLEAVRAEVTEVVSGLRSMQFSKYRNQPDWAWMNAGGLANRLRAALSAAPQPEPDASKVGEQWLRERVEAAEERLGVRRDV